MANIKTRMYRIYVDTECNSLAEAKKYQKQLRDKIAYDIQVKGIMAQAIITIRDDYKLQILVISKPKKYEQTLITYIENNWCTRCAIVYIEFSNIGIIKDFINLRVGKCAFCSNKDFKYTFKQYYNEYRKFNNRLSWLNIENVEETPYIDKLGQLSDFRNTMENYFKSFTIDYEIKRTEKADELLRLIHSI